MKKLIIILLTLTFVSCTNTKEITHEVKSTITEKEFIPEHTEYGMHYGLQFGKMKMHMGNYTVYDEWRTCYVFKGETKTISGEQSYNMFEVGDEVLVKYVEKKREKKGQMVTTGFRVEEVTPLN